ncbi:MAG: 50S ribosomal protein L4 [Spirochaetaceae bacterium]|nr:MAG: 50S ribosomal protein L4 [Spirochaetaceae bacterium]
MKAKVYKTNGSVAKEIDLADDVFGIQASEGAIYHAIRNENANRRAGTACTKTRKEVHGSNTKPWRQKGTGRARAGDKKSPVWVGGGIVFGPKPRDYSYSLPKKVKRLAMKSLLSMKTKSEQLRVVEDFSVESGKTKDLVKLLEKLSGKEKTVLIIPDDNVMMKRAGANIPWLQLLTYNKLTARDLFYSNKVLLLENAAVHLNTFFGG